MPDVSRSYVVPGAPQVTTTVYSGGVIVTTNPPATDASGTVTRSGQVTANFTANRAAGNLPQNAFRYEETNIGASMGISRLVDVVDPRYPVVRTTVGAMGFSRPFLEPITIPLSQLNQANLIKARLAGKVKDLSVDLSVVAGELRETRSMFVSIATAVYNAVTLARKGRYRQAFDALGVRPRQGRPATAPAANGWLLLNYGILPLIRDLQGAIEALEKGLLKEKYTLVKAHDTLTDRVVESSGGYTLKWEITSEVSGRLKYRVSSAYTATLASLGLLNPLTTGWELTKLSFVVDWLVGVGAWLGQVDAYFGKQFHSGSITYFLKVECRGVYVYKGELGRGVTLDTIIRREYNHTSCLRSPMVSFPIAVLPVLRNPVSLDHVATATSLLVQLKRN